VGDVNRKEMLVLLCVSFLCCRQQQQSERHSCEMTPRQTLISMHAHKIAIGTPPRPHNLGIASCRTTVACRLGRLGRHTRPSFFDAFYAPVHIPLRGKKKQKVDAGTTLVAYQTSKVCTLRDVTHVPSRSILLGPTPLVYSVYSTTPRLPSYLPRPLVPPSHKLW